MSSLPSFDLDIPSLLCKHLLRTNGVLRAIVCTEELERVPLGAQGKVSKSRINGLPGYSKHCNCMLHGIWGALGRGKPLGVEGDPEWLPGAGDVINYVHSEHQVIYIQETSGKVLSTQRAE